MESELSCRVPGAVSPTLLGTGVPVAVAVTVAVAVAVAVAVEVGVAVGVALGCCAAPPELVLSDAGVNGIALRGERGAAERLWP